MRLADLAALLLGLAPLAPAWGDTVYLANGRTFENVIAKTTETEVKIRMPGGSLSLPRSHVLRVESSDSDFAEYLRRKEAIRRSASAADWLALAQWAKRQGLEQGAREAALAAAHLDTADRRAGAPDARPGLRPRRAARPLDSLCGLHAAARVRLRRRAVDLARGERGAPARPRGGAGAAARRPGRHAGRPGHPGRARGRARHRQPGAPRAAAAHRRRRRSRRACRSMSSPVGSAPACRHRRLATTTDADPSRDPSLSRGRGPISRGRRAARCTFQAACCPGLSARARTAPTGAEPAGT